MEVFDLDRSIAFYVEVLGFEIFQDDRGNPDQASVKGVVAGFGVELAQAKISGNSGARRPFGVPLGSPFLSFSVRNIEEAFERLKGRGLVEVAAPSVIHGVKFFYVYDPDGQAIELIQFPPPLKALADLRSYRGLSSA
jgi:glyoxylase I family protein